MIAALHPRENERLAALRETGLLDSPPTEVTDRLVSLAAQITGSPISAVSLVDEHRQYFPAIVGLSCRQTPRDVSFCAHSILQADPLVVPDATQDTRFRDNPLVTGDPGIRFYAGVPLITGDGLPLGSLCVIDSTPRSIGPAELMALRTLGDLAVQYLELHRRTRQLEAARQAAEAAATAKAAFLANMSHEIRTPLTAMLGYAELLGDESVGAEQRREGVNTIRRNGEHLLAVINDVLDYSKIEAGRMAVHPMPTDVAAMTEEVVRLFTTQARQRHITLRVSNTADLPRAVHVDPTRLRQILVNLVGNAVKFTEHGGVEVRTDYSGGDLRIQVCDTGIGMTPEQLARVGQPFEQADTSTTRRFGGTGLGLSISYRLAELLGGRLTARSSPGQGTTFELHVRALECRPPAAPPAHAPAAVTPLAGVRLLLAEDSPDIGRLIRTLLTRAGATVRLVDNGRSALEACCDRDQRLLRPMPFDLIVTDMQMPQLDGYGLARRLRSLGAEVPIVALTAHALDGEADKCLAAGCDAYASKPVERDRLIRTCLEQLETRRRQAA